MEFDGFEGFETREEWERAYTGFIAACPSVHLCSIELATYRNYAHVRFLVFGHAINVPDAEHVGHYKLLKSYVNMN